MGVRKEGTGWDGKSNNLWEFSSLRQGQNFLGVPNHFGMVFLGLPV
eukprot:CAMPEP_0194446096 /NCGR_PEP_ID=MMETSP0176-20130528/128234_1 /TAXON_ID=216777 /ORGANISM="Proboscia alata, Strain PI-D3" /LENGTH=45 /DNA_ID= /DNA_START= /DNA_END= /DNA_ORIENTATION=